jgi:hypothetical protein
MRKALPVLVVLALLGGLAGAQDAPEARRRIVYVPEEDMDALLEKHGRGVLLSAAEYLDLLDSARAAGYAPAAGPPAGAVVLAGLLAGTVTEERYDLTATFLVRSLKDGLQRAAFPLDRVGVGEVLVDGSPALLSRDAQGGYLLLPGRGDHEVSVALTGRIERQEEFRSFSFGLPAASSLRFDLLFPAKSEVLGAGVGGGLRTEDTADGLKATGFAPPTGTFAAAFRPRREEGFADSVVHSVARTLHRVGPRRLETLAFVQLNVWRRPVRELSIALPAGDVVTDVASPNLSAWAQDESGLVTLRFPRDLMGFVPVALTAERNLPGPGEVVLPAVTVPGAADERGLLAIAFEPGLEGRVTKAEGCARDPIPPGPGPKNRQAEGGEWGPDRIVLTDASAAYRYWSKDRSISVRTTAPELRVECGVTAVFEIAESMLVLRADLAFRIEGGRVFLLTPSFAADYELLGITVDAPVASRWDRMPGGAVRIEFPAGVPAGSPLHVTATLRKLGPVSALEDATLAIPVPDPGPGVTVRGRLAVLSDESFEVREKDLSGLTSEPVDRLGFPAARLGYGWRKAPVAGSLTVLERTPEVSVRHIALVAPGERTVVYRGFLHYTIRQAGEKTFRFVVPGGFGDRLHVRAPGTVDPVRRTDEQGRDVWEVTLPRPVRGDVFLLLEMETEMETVEGRRTFLVPEVLVVDVPDETGYIAVESGDNMEVTAVAEGLREIGSDEMEPLFRNLGIVPARGLYAAFRYTAHPWSLEVRTFRHEEAKLLTAFVRSAKLLTVVAADGTTRTRAVYSLLNAGRQFLRVRLPAGATLWGALVGGQPVKPALAGGETLIPLTSTGGENAVEVVLLYEGAGPELTASGRLSLAAPEIAGVPGAEAEWSVWLPQGYRVTESSGVFGAAPPEPPSPWLFRFLSGLASAGAMGARDASAPPGATAPMTRDTRRHGRHDGDRGRAAAELVIRDAQVSDHNETDNDMPFEESLGVDDFISDAPFEGPMPTNAQEEFAPPPAPAPPAADPGQPARSPMPAEPAPSGGSEDGADGIYRGPAGEAPPKVVPPPMLGRRGGLSFDVPLVTGGEREVVRALGVRGGVSIAYVDGRRREAGAAVLGAFTALVTLGLAFALRRRLAPAFFALLVLAFATAGPAVFVARDASLWDGLAQGALAALAIIVLSWPVRWLLRRARPVAAGAAIVLFVLLFAPATFAAPEPEPETVYVPFNPADLGVLGRSPERVFLPFEKFRELWNAAHPERRIEKPFEAPVPWLLTGAGYSVTIEDETARIEARFDLVVLAEGYVEVALPLAPAVVESAVVDDAPVKVLSRDGAHVLVLAGKGAKRVDLVLRALVRRENEVRVVEIARPPVPRTLLTFTEPFDGAEVTFAGPVEPVKDGAKYTALLGAGDSLAIRWRAKPEAAEMDSRIEVETRESLALHEGKVECVISTEWRAVTGSFAEARFSLDAEYRLLIAMGPDVKDFAERDGVLTVRLRRVVKDATRIDLRLLRADGNRERATGIPSIAPLGVVKERGLVSVWAASGLRLAVGEARNLERIAGKPEDFAAAFPAGVELHSAYRLVGRPVALAIAAEAVRAEVRVEIPVQHLIEREWVHSRATFKFDVRGDGNFEFPVRLPASAEIESVAAEGLARWWRDGDTVVFSTTSPVRGVFAVNAAWRTPVAPDAVRVDLPEVHALNATRERGWILVSHAPALSLTLLADEGLVKEDVAAYAPWGKIDPEQVNAYGWRQEGGAYRLAVARTFPMPRLSPSTTTRLQMEDDRVVVDVLVSFVIENAGADTFRVFLPEGEGAEPVLTADRQRGAKFEAGESDGRKGTWLTLTLQQAATGLYRFSIVYEKMLDAAGRVEVRGLEPEGENASSFVLLTNISRGEVTFDRQDGLTAADAATFPWLPPGLDARLVRGAFRGPKAAFRLPLALVIHEFADFPDALITSAELTAAVGRDGAIRSRMAYRVLNRTRQFLELTLPAGAQLESVRVSGRGVKPGRRLAGGEERLLVPLSRMQLGDVSTEVEVFYGLPPRDDGLLRDFSLLEPAIHGLTVERTFFKVVLPEGYRYSFDGNMKLIAEVAQQVYRVEKLQEEYDRLNDVLLLGSTFEKARAGENLAQLRTSIESESRAAMDNFRQGIGSLDEKQSVAELTREQQDELRKQVAEQKTKLDLLQQKLERQDLEAAARGGLAQVVDTDNEDPTAGEDGDMRARTENVFRVEGKDAAKEQAEQSYRFSGKRNLRAQGWEANRDPGAGKGQNGQVMEAQTEEGLHLAVDSIARLLESSKVIAGFVVQGGPMPQTAAPAKPGDGEFTRAPNPGGAGGGGVGVGGGAGGAFGPGEGDAVTSVPSGRYGFDFDTEGRAVAPETKAGLLSLPVHVPEKGEIHRFEKLNGGARLTVSVGTPGAGRPLLALALFALVALALLFAPRLLRKW